MKGNIEQLALLILKAFELQKKGQVNYLSRTSEEYQQHRYLYGHYEKVLLDGTFDLVEVAKYIEENYFDSSREQSTEETKRAE